ncbi:MAG: DEAD/DEAH box helicase family protein, partial [Clostridia bacterium]|nr:DEAD/DEAH box helicase family protein [Clostridia bacterium]
MKSYQEFLKEKEISYTPSGFECEERNPALFVWQNDIVKWALRKGKVCIFSDCGTGKTRILLQWGSMVSKHEGRPVLILAPLAVAVQTKKEGEKCGIPVRIVRDQAECGDGLNI